MTREQVDKAWLDVARDAGRQDREGEVLLLRAEIERLRRDSAELDRLTMQWNTARTERVAEIERLRAELATCRADIERHMREKVELAGMVSKERDDNERLRAALREIMAECGGYTLSNDVANRAWDIACRVLEPKS